MSTYDYTEPGVTGYAAHDLNKVVVADATLDFAAISAARASADPVLDAFVASDVVAALDIPAGSVVLAVGADITTASGATATVDVGDSSDVDKYIDGANANAVGHSSSIATKPVLYNTAGTIDIKFATGVPGALVVRVWAVIANCS